MGEQESWLSLQRYEPEKLAKMERRTSEKPHNKKRRTGCDERKKTS